MIQLSRRTASIGVCACIVVAALLRYCALGAGLPCEIESDGMILAQQVQLIQQEDLDREAFIGWRMYPHLVAEIAALIPARILGGTTLEEHLAQASSTIVRVRFVSALLSLLLIPATYWIARRFLPRGPALLAAFLSAVSLLTLLFAQQARPHAPAAALALLTVVAALRLARKPTWLNCSLAGVALGLAIGTLQSGAAASLPIAAAWILRDRSRADGAHRWRAPLWLASLAGAIAYALYAHAAPAAPGAPTPESGFMGLTFNTGGPSTGENHVVHLDVLDGSGFFTVARSLLSYEPMPLIAALVALALGLRSSFRRDLRAPVRRDLLVVAAYALPYLLVIGLYARTYERFCLQLVPFMACLAAATWWGVALRSSRRLAVALLLVIALPGLLASISLQRVRSRPDGAQQLAHWIEDHVAPATEGVLLIPGVDVPLARTPEVIATDARAAFGTPWILYQRLHVHDVWDCPRYALTHSPLLRRSDIQAAIENPREVMRSTPAAFVALLAPSADRSPTTATRVAEAFQLELFGEAKLAFRAPIESQDALTQPIICDELAIRMTVWTWRLLIDTPTIGSTYEIYRLH